MKKSLIALALSVLKPQLPEFEIKPASIGYLKQHPLPAFEFAEGELANYREMLQRHLQTKTVE